MLSEFYPVVISIIIITAVLAVLDVKSFWSKANISAKQTIKHSLYILSALILYGIVGWIVTIPLLSSTELVTLFAPIVIPEDISLEHYLLVSSLLIVSFYFGALIDYTVHRWFSHTKVFWWTHEYHHVPKTVMLLMPGIAIRPFSFFITLPTVVGMLALYTLLFSLLSLPTPLYSLIALVLLAYALVLILSHSMYCREKFLWLHKILKPLAITSPQEHILHHAATLNGNYGNMSTLWDRLLGTYLDPKHYDLSQVQIGVNYTQDFYGAITFNKLRLPKKYQKRFSLYHQLKDK